MRKSVIFGLILFLIVLGGAIFLWFVIPEKETQELKGKPEDYKVRETAKGRWIENEKAGLRVKVPDNWTVEKIDVMQGSMVMYSPDAEGVRGGEKVRPPLKKGCVIETAVTYKTTNLEEIRQDVENAHRSLIIKSDKFEIIKVDGVPALKNIFDSADLGYSIDVYIPTKDKLYGVGITASPEDIKRCLQEFDKFLETVEIKQK